MINVNSGRALREVLSEYLVAASSKINSKLQLGSNGVCVFKQEKYGLEFAIELPCGIDVVYFYSPVCRVPYEGVECFFEKILENNLHGIGNNQATFGLDIKTQSIVLSYSIAMRHLDDVSFTNILFNFIKTAEHAHVNTARWLSEIEKDFSLSDEELGYLDDESLEKMKMKV